MPIVMWSPAAQKQIDSWQLSDDLAAVAKLSEDDGAKPAIVIPYFLPSGEPLLDGDTPFTRQRLLSQVYFGKGPKYLQARGTKPHLYYPPNFDWQSIAPDTPIVITEGEIKALVACSHNIPTIALGGVSSFGREVLLTEFDFVSWDGRTTYICFDSDAAQNSQVVTAEARLIEALQIQKRARCSIVRLPPAADGGKVGLDDYLHANGFEAFLRLLSGAYDVSALDAKVIALNKSCAWVTREGMIYDLDERMWVRKDVFSEGSRFSHLHHFVPAAKGGQTKRLSITKTWLTHPHAQRYAEALFRPGEGPSVQGDYGRTAMNLWSGYEGMHEGDVTPFLRLTEYLESDVTEDSVRGLMLNLMAYKAQNPSEKIPLAIILVGPQGSGKSLWADVIREAFAPYSVVVSSRALMGEFQGWLETSLIAVINEAETTEMRIGADVLKTLISDLQRPMNEKYRPVRQINSYTTYIVTTNHHAATAFEADDRRMIVINCPKPNTQAFYDDVLAWRRAGGPKALMHWLVHRDLQGWRPPQTAPMTAEKHMAYVESLSPAQRLVLEMRKGGQHAVKMWLDGAVEWAKAAEVGNNTTMQRHASEVLESVKHYQIRPFYTAEELLLIFPSMLDSLAGSRGRFAPDAGLLSRELRQAGVPYLRPKDDPLGFYWRGRVRQYLVIADFDEWAQPIGQDQFEHYMEHFPKYGDLR